MSFDKKDAAQKADFIDFAYNMFSPGVLRPPADPGIAAGGYQLIYYLNATDFHSREFYGYIARSVASPGKYILAIRGTQTLAEWILDAAAIPVFFGPAPDAGLVALGFMSIYGSFSFIDASGAAKSLQTVVTELAATGAGIEEFLVLGHSLGAALATLAAAELAIVNPGGVQSKVVIYTFASPRVGLLDFAASFNDAVPTSFRIWNTLDIVPQLPPFPFIHVSGLGDSIVQTQQQLETLLITPPCEHHLTSYQWLLDSTDFALNADCSDLDAQDSFAVMAAAAGHGPEQQKSAGRAMRKAFAGHA